MESCTWRLHAAGTMGLDRPAGGYPFPLVRRPPGDQRDRRGLPRYLVRRLAQRDGHERLLSEALASLNALEGARASGSLQCREPRQARSAAEISPTRESVLRRLGRSLRHALPRPAEREAFPDGALCELLKVQDLYAAMESGATHHQIIFSAA